jgi:hypothetical protein
MNMLDDLFEIAGAKAQAFVPSAMPHMLRISLSSDFDLRQVFFGPVTLISLTSDFDQ